ncbi:MAG: RRXRR domain-containing protein [Actinobacteria bacterium]|nr:RRXRR domain-containing protein [Actinomycetota bacterium]
MLVYVLNKDGKALMPCHSGKARILLKEKKARVVKRIPFTIQLIYGSTGYKQPITLGVDAGYSKIGLSAVSKKRELLSGEVKLRKDIIKLLSVRRTYRRTRRVKKLWHRKPRFNNRVSSKKKGWLAPSIQHKFDSHIRVIDKVREILPISDVIIEVASFDIQKIKNPDISGVEYQNGPQKNYYNTREYVFHRDNHLCQNCKGKSKDPMIRPHHIKTRQTGGNRPDNQITLCETCHGKVTAGELKLDVKPSKGFKAETFMTTVRWKLVEQLNKIMPYSVSHTYGYITKFNREPLGLEKSHINDAFVIANGTKQKRCKLYTITQTRRNNRSIQTNRKGHKLSIRRKRYKLQPNDMVKFNKKIYKVKGVFNYGTWVRLSNDSKVIDSNIKNVSLVSYGKGLQFRYPIHLSPNSNELGRSLLG